MPSEPDTKEESKIPAELDLGDQPAPEKKTPARKAAKKAKPEEGSEKASSTNEEEKSDMRPTDFRGRGSHFDDVDTVEDAPDTSPSETSSRNADNGEDEPRRNSEDGAPSENARRQKGGNQNQGGHRRIQGNQKNKKSRQKHPHQKNNRKGGGSWKQPPPPRDTDHVGGVLPDASRYSKFDDIEALRADLEPIKDPMDLSELYELPMDQARLGAEALGVEFEEKPGRKQIIERIFKLATEKSLCFKDSGFLDVSDDGHGFVVHEASNYQLKPESVYVPAALIRHYSLKRGHEVEVIATPPLEGERCPLALKIVSAMGGEPQLTANVPAFEDLIPYYPTERFVLETPMPSNSKKDVSMRAFDILTPIGLGQRGLIVAPPRTGKTILLQGLAHSVQENYPNVHLIVLLIDERPEEVTDFRRKVKGEVVSSTFDETASSHVHAAEMVVEKARRMVETGRDVVILLDSITRLARAYNALASNSGKIMSGGIEATALQKPKRFFGSARNIEDGGSLTIMGTALVDTGSKMDEVIFEEFKGTGNMEIHLDRDLINKRVFPAINFERSGTRKEELLYHPQELEKVYGLRRVMQGVPGVEAMEMLIKRLKATKSNAEFLMSLK